jgi:KDO2-lipid IV(A) lauroyltransferase
MASRLAILVMRGIGLLPLSWVRALGWLLGWLLYAVVVPRRRVVRANLLVCFPQWTGQQRTAMVPRRGSIAAGSGTAIRTSCGVA